MSGTDLVASVKYTRLINLWKTTSKPSKWLKVFNDPARAGDALAILALIHLAQFTGDSRVLLLEELVARVDDESVLSGDWKEGAVPKSHLRRIGCSLYYFSLFAPATRKASSLLDTVMRRWKPLVSSFQNTGVTGLMNRTMTLLEYGMQTDLMTMYLKEAIEALTSAPRLADVKMWCICGLMFTRLHQLIVNHDPLVPEFARVLLQVLQQQQHRSNQSTVLVLHIVFMFVSLSSNVDKQWCADAMAAIRPYLICPDPLGSSAMRLLQKLNVDRVVPGTSWREKVEVYLPWLTSEDVVTEPHSPKAYVFCGSGDPINVQLGVPLDHDPLSHRVARSVLRQVLACHLGVSPETIPLGSVSEKKARTHYAQLRSELLAIQRGTNSRSCKRVASAHLKKLAANNDSGDGRHHTSSRIVFDFVPYVINFDCTLSANIAGTNLPHRQAFDQLSSLLLRCVDDGVRVLRLMLSGTDSDFHHFVGAFVGLRAAEPEAFSQVNVQLFYLGCQQYKSSALCKYLAGLDFWWSANVCGAIRAQNMVFPRPQPKNPRAANSTLGQQLEAYIIGARTAFNMPVFECECSPVEAGKAATHTIPFALFGHVGRLADAKLFHSFHGLPHSFLMSEVVSAKAFSSKPVTFALEYTSASVDGAAQDTQRITARSWSSLSFQLISLPKHLQGSDTPPVMLSQRIKPWLEIVAVESSKKNKKRPSATKHVIHALSVTLEAPPGDSFHLVLDGVPYGPFAKVFLRQSTVCPEISIQLCAPQ